MCSLSKSVYNFNCWLWKVRLFRRSGIIYRSCSGRLFPELKRSLPTCAGWCNEGRYSISISLALSLFLLRVARGENKERLSSFRRTVSVSSAGTSFRTNICHSTTTRQLRVSGCFLRPFVSSLPSLLRGEAYFAQIQFACLRTRPTPIQDLQECGLACPIFRVISARLRSRVSIRASELRKYRRYLPIIDSILMAFCNSVICNEVAFVILLLCVFSFIFVIFTYLLLFKRPKKNYLHNWDQWTVKSLYAS